jgi:hypothetical protein
MGPNLLNEEDRFIFQVVNSPVPACHWQAPIDTGGTFFKYLYSFKAQT